MGPVEVLWDRDGVPQKGHGTSGSIMGWRWGSPPPRVWTDKQTEIIMKHDRTCGNTQRMRESHVLQAKMRFYSFHSFSNCDWLPQFDNPSRPVLRYRRLQCTNNRTCPTAPLCCKENYVLRPHFQ